MLYSLLDLGATRPRLALPEPVEIPAATAPPAAVAAYILIQARIEEEAVAQRCCRVVTGGLATLVPLRVDCGHAPPHYPLECVVAHYRRPRPRRCRLRQAILLHWGVVPCLWSTTSVTKLAAADQWGGDGIGDRIGNFYP
jgi:hypothetical protein